MKKVQLQAGDLVTVKAVSEDYKGGQDFRDIKVRSQELPGGEDAIAKLMFESQIFKVEKHDVHEDLAKRGVNVGHYAIRGEDIEIFAVHDKQKRQIKVNGEHIIDLGGGTTSSLSETFFFDEGFAYALANSLNKIELEKMKELEEAVGKAVVTLEQIVDKQFV
jgi:hypothetical protein